MGFQDGSLYVWGANTAAYTQVDIPVVTNPVAGCICGQAAKVQDYDGTWYEWGNSSYITGTPSAAYGIVKKNSFGLSIYGRHRRERGCFLFGRQISIKFSFNLD